MKRVFYLFLLAGISFCCKKEAVSPTSQPGNSVFFKDNNLVVSNFTATPEQDGSIEVNFLTQILGNVSKVELMSGENTNTFCTIYILPLQSNSAIQAFSFDDSHPKGNPVYYMIRYQLADGSFGGFSPVYKQSF